MKEQANPPEPQAPAPTSLPKREYLLLPLISLATILVAFGASEFLTRMIWPEQTFNTCAIEGSNRFKPNCNATLKNAEGPWVTYHYNNCGYRGVVPCGPKPPGTIRIVVLGSSMAYGTWVPYEQMYSTIAASALTRTCNQAVEVQNLAGSALVPLDVYRRVQEAVELKPDVVIYLLGTWDVEQKVESRELSETNNSPTPEPSADHWSKFHWLSAALRARVDGAMMDLDFHPNDIVHHPLSHIRTRTVVQHLLFQDRDAYLRTISGDGNDYLRQPFTPAWQQRFANFDVIVGDIADKLRTAGVPLVVIPIPSRKQAALFGVSRLPPHVDPYAFGRQIQTIASSHGAEYLDLTDPFSRIPDAERLFYVADAHPTADAQQVIARALLQKLQDGSFPAFSHCTLQQTAEKEQ